MDIFILVKDVLVLLVSQLTVVHEVALFLWEPEAHGGIGESHSVGVSCRERVESMCEKTGS